MDKNSKLQTFYFMVILSFILLSSLVYLVMEKIENHTTMLENHVHKRHLGYIVDKDYTLEVSKKKDETVHFLNSLTDFFETFHDKTVHYKKQLETFMTKRKNIIKRFNQSSINIYDLTVVPNKDSTYHFQPRTKENMENYQKQLSRNFRQVPFSRILKFKIDDISKIKNNTYLLCTARIQAKSDKPVNVKLSIVSNQESVTDDMFVDYTIKTKQTSINLNRILRITNVKKANVKIIGTSEDNFEVIKVGAYCLNFNDIGTQEEQQFNQFNNIKMGNSDSNQKSISHGLRIIKIFQNSPASKTDLCIYTDFIVDVADKPEGFQIDRDFYKYVIQNENQTIRLFVHNILTQKTRFIDLLLTRDWPNSDFLLGFKVRHENMINSQKNIYRILDVFNPALKKIVVPKNFFFMAIEEFSYDDLNDLKAKLKLYQKCSIVFFDVGTLNVIIVPFIYNPRTGLGFELGNGYLHDLQYIIQSLIKNREKMSSLQYKDEKTQKVVEMQYLRQQYKDQFQNQEQQKLGLVKQENMNTQQSTKQNKNEEMKNKSSENQQTQDTSNKLENQKDEKHENIQQNKIPNQIDIIQEKPQENKVQNKSQDKQNNDKIEQQQLEENQEEQKKIHNIQSIIQQAELEDQDDNEQTIEEVDQKNQNDEQIVE